MTEEEILAQNGRPGWKVIGRNVEMEDRTQLTQSGDIVHTKVPGKNWVWVIAPPGGEGLPDELTVKIVEGGGGRGGVGYEIVKPPTKQLPKATVDTTSPGETTYQDDPANPGQQIGGRIVNGVFQPITGLNGQPLTRPKPTDKATGPETQIVGGDLFERNPQGGWTKVIAKAGDPVTREVGGALHQYDPATGKWTLAVAAPPAKPEPPRVTSSTNVQWEDIPESDQQQGYEIVNGQKRVLEGVTRKKDEPPTTMVGGADDPKWTFLDKQGNVVRTVDNPAYKEKPPTYASVTTGDEPFITSRRSDTGALIHEPTPGYLGKTKAEIAAQVGRLQSTAQAKRDELKAKISGTYTAEQASADFNTWWDQNVAPQASGLEQAQRTADLEEQKAMAATRVAAQTAATAAGTGAVNAYEAGKGRRVGMNANAVMQQAATGSLKGVDWQGSALYRGRDPEEIAREATANALKGILPEGGQAPAWTGTSPGQALDRTTYQSAFAPAPVAAAESPAGASIQMPEWLRADQANGMTPAGDAMAAGPGLTGTVAPDDPRYLGPRPDVAVPDYVPPEEVMPAPVAAPVAVPVMQRRLLPPRPMPMPPQVNMDPFYQQALAAGLGAGGLGPENYYPPQYQYGGMYPTQNPW